MPVPLALRLFGALSARALDGLETKTPDQLHDLRRDPLEGRPAPVVAVLGRIFGSSLPDVDSRTVQVPGAEGPLPARIHTPLGGRGPRPAILHLHGGGFVIGNPGTYDWLCSAMAAELGCVVVSLDYRKAPEHRAPAAAADAVAVMRWLASEDGRSAQDVEGMLAVVGDSAGGNLAAVSALAARDDGLDLAAQVLIYPVTDLTPDQPNRPEHDAATMLPRAHREFFSRAYVDAADPTDWRISPALATDHSGLATALVITGQHDPLRDQGTAYADLLRTAGVHVRLTDYVDMPHGFMAAPGLTISARQAAAEIIAFLKPLVRPAD